MIKDIIIILLSIIVIALLCKPFLRKMWNKFSLGQKIVKKILRYTASKNNNESSVDKTNKIPPILTKEHEQRLSDSIRLTFTGDLILLKDMVENGFDKEHGYYSFDSMFRYVKEYYDQADFNIGVFEGPVAGEEKGFSTSCFADGIPIYLNFPQEYAEAVKRAGFDLVTLANNHMLDQGVDGLYHTLDALDEVGLPHIGAYRDEEEKKHVRIVEVKGQRIALLSYTYGSNYHKTNFFFQEGNRHLTNIIRPQNDKYYKECLTSVRRDFDRVKSQNPDVIIVLPHMGKQFMHEPDGFQKHWCGIFAELGADIILSDHPHAVQPLEWVKSGNRNVLVVHCPGNYINSYTKRDGDASMIVECYLEKSTGKPFAASIIPIYAYSKWGRDHAENFVGVPIYKIMKDETVCPSLSRYEYNRIAEVQSLVTKTALGIEVKLDGVQNRYYTFVGEGYLRQRTSLVVGEAGS